jgi:transcriptional regulator with XRE-family HTH domain
MEPIVDYLRRRLREAGPKSFPEIARATGVAPTLLPKLAYGQRDNPRVQTIQPLLDFFQEVERGDRAMGAESTVEREAA